MGVMSYPCSEQESGRKTFRSEFTVENGAWQREVFGQDEKIRKFGYDFSVDGSCYNTIYKMVFTRRESGTRDVFEHETQEWQIDKSGNVLEFPVDLTIIETQTASQYFDMQHQTGSTTLRQETEKYDQEWTSLTHRVTPPQGSPSETFWITGTSSGMQCFSDDTALDYFEYKDGVIYFDTTTNEIAGKSSAKTVISPHDYNNLSHDWMTVDYCDFTNGSGSKTIKRDFDVPHTLYLDSFTSYSGSVTLDYNGSGGVGVSFPGCTTDRESEIFDSGVDKYFEQTQTQYEQPDLSGVPAEMPEFIFTSGGKKTPVSSTLPTSKEAVQSIIDLNNPGYYMIIYVHTEDNGHAWLGAVQLEKEDGKIIIKESDYRGWGPKSRLGFGAGVISDHNGYQYDVARFYQLTQNQYKKLKEEMKIDKFNGQYDWPNSNCVHWVEGIIGEIKKIPGFRNPEAGLGIDSNTEVFPKPNSSLADRLPNTQQHVKDKRVPLVLQRKLLQDLRSYPSFGHVPPEIKTELENR